jgi:hypothetical protein
LKIRSAKNKGQRASKEVREMLLERFQSLEDDDLFVTPSGVNGCDLLLSPKSKVLLPFAFEVKNQERLNIWAAIKQAQTNAKNNETPVVVFRKNRERLFIALPLASFLTFLKDGD